MTDSESSKSNTSYCTSCGEAVSEDANFCPSCGADISVDKNKIEPETDADISGKASEKPRLRHRLPGINNKNTTRRNVLFGTGYTILGLAVLGSAVGGQEISQEEQYPTAFHYDKSTGILIEDGVTAETDSIGILYIRGTAINKSDQDYSYVQLSWGIYDSSGAKVGDGLANISGLKSEQSWRFKAIAAGVENPDSYDISNIAAY